MLNISLNEKDSIVILEPQGELAADDFKNATSVIDPFIEAQGKLNGVIIHTQFFPGWDSFEALTAHLAFVKDHHRKVNCVALVTDSALGGFAEHIGDHFVSAHIKKFGFEQFDQATQWIIDSNKE